ncbi:BAMBI-like protein [Mya arenaria]|uniref:BAMBI-like protein n=1 Tax=Mya arenaria TaxID=6604 RepID=A0ABY7EL35_MYAAR|nr:BAMBI-like protein [Mya arenaria]
MCKSQLGMCFTHVKVKDGVKSIVSGCADSLQEEPLLSTCAGTGIEATETELTVNETRVINDVIDDVTGVEVKETTVVESLGVMSSKKTDESNKAQKDLWFKAAVIAVPIAGGFILILLVLLAVRMLRTDSRQHKRLIQIRRERSLTKAQLYVTDHFIDREKDKNTCTIGQGDSLTQPSNTIFTGHVNSAIHNNNSQNPNSKRETVHSTHLNSNSKCHHHHHHHHSNKNNHPKATRHRDGHTYEQILSQTNSDTSTGSGERDCQTSPHSSVIVWGKSDNTNSADVV